MSIYINGIKAKALFSGGKKVESAFVSGSQIFNGLSPAEKLLKEAYYNFDSTKSSSIVVNPANGEVTEWKDLNGHGSFVKLSAYKGSTVVEKNGIQLLDSDGDERGLGLPGFQSFVDLLNNGTFGATVMCVAGYAGEGGGGTDGRRFWFETGGNYDFSYFYGYKDSDAPYTQSVGFFLPREAGGATAPSLALQTTMPTDGLGFMSATCKSRNPDTGVDAYASWNGTQETIYENATQMLTWGSANNLFLFTFRGSNNRWGYGNIGAIAFWPRVLTAEELSLMAEYYMNKFNISANEFALSNTNPMVSTDTYEG